MAHRCAALRTERRTARTSLASGNAAAAADRFLPIPLPRLPRLGLTTAGCSPAPWAAEANGSAAGMAATDFFRGVRFTGGGGVHTEVSPALLRSVR